VPASSNLEQVGPYVDRVKGMAVKAFRNYLTQETNYQEPGLTVFFLCFGHFCNTCTCFILFCMTNRLCWADLKGSSIFTPSVEEVLNAIHIEACNAFIAYISGYTYMHHNPDNGFSEIVHIVIVNAGSLQ
jgi:hypothetical protein